MKTIQSLYEYAIPSKETTIGSALAGWQESLVKQGTSLGQTLQERYLQKWQDPQLGDVLSIRTMFVLGMQEFLAGKGLMNIDRVSLSPITDPLCHDVEHVPVIRYQGVPYRTTHSMIYSKFLACINPAVRGVFIDSPNIRLELPHKEETKKRKYLIDFSQMDIEAKRRDRITDDDYFDEPAKTASLLERQRDDALEFFEDLIIHSVRKVKAMCPECLASLGVTLEVPMKPFPRFYKDESGDDEGMEARLGAKAGTQFFWVLGLLRENYDLVYPFLKRDGSVSTPSSITSKQVFNYDLCAAAKIPRWFLWGSLRSPLRRAQGMVLSGYHRSINAEWHFIESAPIRWFGQHSEHRRAGRLRSLSFGRGGAECQWGFALPPDLRRRHRRGTRAFCAAPGAENPPHRRNNLLWQKPRHHGAIPVLKLCSRSAPLAPRTAIPNQGGGAGPAKSAVR